MTGLRFQCTASRGDGPGPCCLCRIAGVKMTLPAPGSRGRAVPAWPARRRGVSPASSPETPRQEFIEVTQVVLAELPCGISHRLQLLRDGWRPRTSEAVAM